MTSDRTRKAPWWSGPDRTRRTRRAFTIAAPLVLLTGCLLPDGVDVPNPGPGQLPPATVAAAEARTDGRDLPYSLEGCPPTGAAAAYCRDSRILDTYPRLAGSPRGTLVFIHGGGFIGGDHRPLTDTLLLRQRRRGWDLVSIQYRTNPPEGHPAPYPAALHDVAAALHDLRANPSRFGIDNRRIIVVGHSAGGGLAALAGTTANSRAANHRGMPVVDGWVSIAGVISDTAGGMSAMWLSFWALPNRNPPMREMAAVRHIDAWDPPGYVIHGADDTFVEAASISDAERVTARTGADVTFDLVDVDAAGRSLGHHRGHSPATGINLVAFEQWLDRIPAAPAARSLRG